MADLTADEKAALTGMWREVDTEKLGSEALERLLIVYPHSRRYFDHFAVSRSRSATEDDPNLKVLGKKVMDSFGEALKHLDNLNDTFASLSELHRDKMHVDPENFKLLGSMIVIVLSRHFGNDFTPALQGALEKLVAAVVAAMAHKYY
ncbi:hemoglobin subunit beta-like [Psammomys obesus]|uniref:hemoglobin subunit beta-like n=1 Tax=Psammomys obesus TaxID=48139 RepID=UPI0024531A85|nr:hemoglobin subunit beta-like [Psammomys obesus]